MFFYKLIQRIKAWTHILVRINAMWSASKTN